MATNPFNVRSVHWPNPKYPITSGLRPHKMPGGFQVIIEDSWNCNGKDIAIGPCTTFWSIIQAYLCISSEELSPSDSLLYYLAWHHTWGEVPIQCHLHFITKHGLVPLAQQPRYTHFPSSGWNLSGPLCHLVCSLQTERYSAEDTL